MTISAAPTLSDMVTNPQLSSSLGDLPEKTVRQLRVLEQKASLDWQTMAQLQDRLFTRMADTNLPKWPQQVMALVIGLFLGYVGNWWIQERVQVKVLAQPYCDSRFSVCP